MINTPMLDSNYLIVNRHAQRFTDMKLTPKAAIFLGEDGRPVDFGVLQLQGSLYAAIYCDEVRNITFITDRGGIHDVVTILWNTDEGYHEGFKALKAASGKTFYRQNKKLNRYAESIAEKLDIGVRIRVTDEVDESEMIVCPECGILNPKGSPFCYDCGAEL
jgi:hypothetical protein